MDRDFKQHVVSILLDSILNEGLENPFREVIKPADFWQAMKGKWPRNLPESLIRQTLEQGSLSEELLAVKTTAQAISRGFLEVEEEGFILKSFFPELTKETTVKNYVYRYQPLHESDSLIPVLLDEGNVGELRDHYEAFIAHLTQKPFPKEGSFSIWLSWFLEAIEEYGWCLPVNLSGVQLPWDVYLHLLVAVSSCLLRQTNNQQGFRLLAGDLSGIQDFIFDLRKTKLKGLSKILRARSLYLNLLADVSALHILQEVGLPATCVLTNAGGRYLALLPDDESIIEKVRAEIDRQQAWILGSFLGEVRINITLSPPLLRGDFQPKHTVAVMDQLGRDIEDAKTHFPHQGLGNRDQHVFELSFNPTKGACSVCGKYPGEHKSQTAEGDTEYLCQRCHRLLDLGRQVVRNSGFLVLIPQTQENNLLGQYQIRYVTQLDNIPKESLAVYDMQLSSVSKYVPRVAPGDLEWYATLPNQEQVQKEINTHNDELMTFTQLAISRANLKQVNNGFHGEPFLAVLKADVDRLGNLFSTGFGDRYQLGLHQALSRMMDRFFNLALKQLFAQDKYRFCYTVFAGGDDLVLIGPWNVMLEFAEDLYTLFKAFTSNQVTLSASLVLAKAHWNMDRVITLAEDYLELAKGDREGEKGRDSIAIFGRVYKWEEFINGQKWNRNLEQILEKNQSYQPPQSWWYQLLYFSQEAQRSKRDLSALIYRSRMHYQIERNLKNKETPKDFTEFMSRLYDVNNEDDLILSRIGTISRIYNQRRYHG